MDRQSKVMGRCANEEGMEASGGMTGKAQAGEQIKPNPQGHGL